MNKRNLILIFTILFSFFLFPSVSKAFTINNEEIVEPPFLDKEYVIFKYDYVYDSTAKYSYYAYVFDSTAYDINYFKPYLNSSKNKIIIDKVNDTTYFQKYSYNYISNTWSRSSSATGLTSNIQSPYVLMSTVDVYDYTKNNVLYNKGYGLSQYNIDFNINKNYDSKNNVVSEDLTIHFEPWDTDLYSYQYSYNGEKWKFLDIQDSILNISSNLTLYTRIIDKNTNENLYSATITISDITSSDSTPKITLKKVTSDILNGEKSCYISSGGQDYTICEVIEYNVENYDFMKHAIYIKRPGDEDYILNGISRFTYDIHKNGTFYIKVVDRETQTVLSSATYTFSTISTDFVNLGVYIDLNNKFNKDTYMSDVEMLFYNLNLEQHNVYYSIDNPNKDFWKKIDNLHWNGTSYFDFTMNFDYDCNLYVIVTDMENNILKTSNISIRYTEQLEEFLENSDSPLEELRYEFSKKFGIFNQIGIILNTLLHFDYDDDSMPEFKINVFGVEMKIIDFEAFDIVRDIIHGIILFFAWFFFLRSLYYRVPAIIGGITNIGKGGRG